MLKTLWWYFFFRISHLKFDFVYLENEDLIFKACEDVVPVPLINAATLRIREYTILDDRGGSAILRYCDV